MATNDIVEQLRARAILLRRFATRIEHVADIGLHRLADDTTWMGPTPQHCRNDLLAWRQRLLTRAAELTVSARRLDRIADSMVAAAPQGVR